MFKFISITFFIILITFKANSEVIKNIEVKNNNRVSKETILIFSKIEVGKDYSENDLNFVIEDLYKTDFFSNIILEIKNGTLIIDVRENKIVQEVIFDGIKRKEISFIQILNYRIKIILIVIFTNFNFRKN